MEIGTIGITGGTGFIGQNVITKLKDKNIPYVLFTGNILDSKTVEIFFKKHHITTLIHLVGSFSLPFENLIDLNVVALQNVLEIGVKYGLKKIVYTSSGAVYGEPINETSTETDPLTPNTLYGLSKVFAEEMIAYYGKKANITHIILRFPNVYGKDSNKGVIYNFLQSIKNTKSVTIAGDGKQMRNFLHVSDAANAIEKALLYNDSDIFNIGSPVNLSINEVVEKLKSKYTFTVRHVKEDNELKKLLLSYEKAEKVLDYKPTIDTLLLT